MNLLKLTMSVQEIRGSGAHRELPTAPEEITAASSSPYAEHKKAVPATPTKNAATDTTDIPTEKKTNTTDTADLIMTS